MSDTVIQALLYALVLVLPLSALAARRISTATIARYATAWFVIFVLALSAVYALLGHS